MLKAHCMRCYLPGLQKDITQSKQSIAHTFRWINHPFLYPPFFKFSLDINALWFIFKHTSLNTQSGTDFPWDFCLMTQGNNCQVTLRNLKIFKEVKQKAHKPWLVKRMLAFIQVPISHRHKGFTFSPHFELAQVRGPMSSPSGHQAEDAKCFSASGQTACL